MRSGKRRHIFREGREKIRKAENVYDVNKMTIYVPIGLLSVSKMVKNLQLRD